MYLDYDEDQAERNNPLYMKDWNEKLNKFIQFNEREILQNPGKISKKVAKALADNEYEKYSNKRIKQESLKTDDFDEFLEDHKDLK